MQERYLEITAICYKIQETLFNVGLHRNISSIELISDFCYKTSHGDHFMTSLFMTFITLGVRNCLIELYTEMELEGWAEWGMKELESWTMKVSEIL